MMTSFKSLFAHNLSFRVSLAVVVPLVILLGMFTFAEYQHLRQLMLGNLSQMAAHSGQVIEDNLRQQMLKTDFESMQQMLNSISENPDFNVIYLLDTSGKVIFAPGNKDVGLQLNNTQPDCLPCHNLPGPARASSIVVQLPDGSRVFRSMNPIENSAECVQCHDPSQRNIGLLLIDINTQSLEAVLNRDLRQTVLWWIGAILVVVVVVNLVLRQLIFQRLMGFSSAIQALSQGEHPPTVRPSQPDEIGKLANTFNAMAIQIEQRRRENEALSRDIRQQNLQRGELVKRLINAQEDERKRLARELHDEFSQSLSALALHAEVAQQWIESDPARAADQMDQLKALVEVASDQMYALILALRPAALDEFGLAVSLRMYATRLLDGRQIELHFDTDQLEPRLPGEVEIVVYRIFQEALNNIARHSRATRMSIRLSRDESGFCGEIQDDGIGFDVGSVSMDGDLPRGLGLLGMRERTAQLSGELNIASAPGKGSILTLRIPLDVSSSDKGI